MFCKEGGLDLGVPGSHHSALPLPAESGGFGPPGVHPWLTNAQTHLGSRAGSPRPAQRGSRSCGWPGGSAPILVVGRQAPPQRRLLPTRSPGLPAPARPSFPSPPGRPCPWRALAARLHPGPVRPAGQPFLARPAESQRWPHPPRPPGSWLAPGRPPHTPSPPPLQ